MDRLMTLSIGEAAKACDLPVKTIRYYEEIGLIPKAVRSNGGVHASGRRLYMQADVKRLRFIYHARLFGLGLGDVRALLVLYDAGGCPSREPQYRRILKKHLDDIEQRIRHLNGLKTTIEDLLSPARERTGKPCAGEACGCMQPGRQLAYVSPSSIKVRKQPSDRV